MSYQCCCIVILNKPEIRSEAAHIYSVLIQVRVLIKLIYRNKSITHIVAPASSVSPPPPPLHQVLCRTANSALLLLLIKPTGI